jgi:hypothetical protein
MASITLSGVIASALLHGSAGCGARSLGRATRSIKLSLLRVVMPASHRLLRINEMYPPMFRIHLAYNSGHSSARCHDVKGCGEIGVVGAAAAIANAVYHANGKRAFATFRSRWTSFLRRPKSNANAGVGCRSNTIVIVLFVSAAKHIRRR